MLVITYAPVSILIVYKIHKRQFSQLELQISNRIGMRIIHEPSVRTSPAGVEVHMWTVPSGPSEYGPIVGQHVYSLTNINRLIGKPY